MDITQKYKDINVK